MQVLMILSAAVILACVAAGGYFLFRRKPGPRGPRARSRLTRIICGSLAAGFMIAVGVGTWATLRSCYDQPGQAPQAKVRVPARPAPELPGIADPVEKARVLVTLAAVDNFGHRLRVVASNSAVLDWPEVRSKPQTIDLSVNGHDAAYELTVNDVLKTGPVGKRTGVALIGVEAKSWWGGSYRTSVVLSKWNVFSVGRYGGSLAVNPVLSIAPGPGQDADVFVLVEALADDDPLKEVTGQEFLALHRDDLESILSDLHWAYRGEAPPPGLAWMAHVHFASAFLVLAAILLAQLFRRRLLAFAGTLAIVILYTAALDRYALSVHAAHMTDPAGAVENRVTACELAAGTFFYGKTAAARLADVAGDAAAPAEVRACAQRNVDKLRSKP